MENDPSFFTLVNKENKKIKKNFEFGCESRWGRDGVVSDIQEYVSSTPSFFFRRKMEMLWEFPVDIWIMIFNDAIENSKLKKRKILIKFLWEIMCMEQNPFFEVAHVILKQKDHEYKYFEYMRDSFGSDDQDISVYYKYAQQQRLRTNFLSDVSEIKKDPKFIRKWEHNPLNHICPKSGYRKPESWSWKNNKKPYNGRYCRKNKVTKNCMDNECLL